MHSEWLLILLLSVMCLSVILLMIWFVQAGRREIRRVRGERDRARLTKTFK
jgi:hypothetical protein